MYIIVGGQKVTVNPRSQGPKSLRIEGNEQPCTEDAMGWKTWYALAVFGLMGMTRGRDPCSRWCRSMTDDRSGFEESLVATMIVQESFIKQFQLSELPPDEEAGVKGNIVAMSQLGCIAGALW